MLAQTPQQQIRSHVKTSIRRLSAYPHGSAAGHLLVWLVAARAPRGRLIPSVKWAVQLPARATEEDDVASLNGTLRKQILERDDYTCRYCGVRPDPLRYYHDYARQWVSLIHVDHVVPRSKGGTDDPSNLVTACAACNLSKYNKDLAAT